MRVGQNPELKHFDDWQLQLGNGQIDIEEEPDSIRIPEELCFEIDDEDASPAKTVVSQQQFIDLVFPDMCTLCLQDKQHWIQWTAERAILAPKNTVVDRINCTLSDQFPGEPTILNSADSKADEEDATRFPVEYLNTLTPAGLPPHRLFLKVNSNQFNISIFFCHYVHICDIFSHGWSL